MTTNVRHLTDGELEGVSGGAAPEGYHFCWNGPAGTGLYPNYVGCIPTLQQLINDFLRAGGVNVK